MLRLNEPPVSSCQFLTLTALSHLHRDQSNQDNTQHKQMSSSTDDDYVYFPPMIDETFAEKFTRKFKADPLIPIGCGLTAAMLFGGLRSFASKQTANSPGQQQNFMRARVGMQGLTVAIMAYGTFYTAVRAGWDTKYRDAIGAPQYKLAGESYEDAAQNVRKGNATPKE